MTKWECSTDPKTWTIASPTLQAKTEIGGLTVGTTYFFRVRGITKVGVGDFTQVVSIDVS